MLPACCPRCGAPLVGATSGICLLCAGRLALDSADLPEQADGPKQGTRLGDYELLEEIGRGAMGVVYRARQLSLKRIVALKVVQSGQFASEGERKRFVAEAELAATLDHPNIVPMHDVGTAEGRPFCAMKFIEGRSLAAMLVEGFCSRRQCEAHRSPSKLLPGVRGCCVTAAGLIAKVARAMHHAHQRGIIHRDLKPGNILVDAAGEPHVTDFGLARRLGTDSSLTLVGSPLGTPAYMSPEQARGERTITTAADIWSLGVLLYELLAGQPPFVAENVPTLLRRIAETEPTAPRRPKFDLPVDPELATICLKCLEKSPVRRYASAAELADDLERWQRNEPILARRHTPWQRALKWTARHPRRSAMLVALLVVFLAGAVGVFWQWRRAELRAQDSRNQLLRLHILNAGRQLEAGDPLAALPWLAGALAGETPSSARREIYRAALANTLRRSPVPEQTWWLPQRDYNFALSAEGQRLLVSGPEAEQAWLLNITDGGSTAVAFSHGGSVAFNPDGSRFAIGGKGQARLFSTTNGAAISPTLLHTGWVTQVAFSPDGRWLATRAEHAGIRLWDVASDAATGSVLSHPQAAWMAFSPGSRRLATTGQDGWVRLWEVPSGSLLATNELGSAGHCEFSPDGQWLLVGRPSGRDAWLLNAATLERVGPRLTHLDYVEHVAFSPDSRSAATGSADGQLRIWSVPRGHPLFPALEIGSEITALRFSPDGQTVATGCRDGRVRSWDAQTGKSASPWLRHAAAVRSLAFLPDNQRLAVVSADGTVRVWHSKPSPPPSLQLRDRVEDVWMAHFNSKATLLIARGPHSARAYDAATGEPLTPPLEHGDKVDWAELNAVGSTLLTHCRDARVRAWSIPQGELRRTWELGEHIVDAAWLAGGKRFVSLAWNGEVAAWSVASNAPLWRWRESSFEGRRLAASPDGRWFAAAFNHTRFNLWDSGNPQPIASQNCPDEVRVIQFSPDSTSVVTGDERGRVQFRRTRDGAMVGKTVRHGERILDLAISPDNRTVASLSADGLVRFSRLSTGEPAGMTIRPATGAQRLAWSAAGRWLLVTGVWQAQVWDAQAGAPMTPLLQLHREIVGAAFSADADHLVIATEDARLRIEPLAAPDWPDDDWQFLARAVSSHEVDATANAVPWFGLADTNTLADAEALTTRWLLLRPRLRELLHGTTTPN